MGAEIYATFIFLVSIMQALVVFSSLGLTSYLSRFIPQFIVEKDSEKIRSSISRTITLRLLFSGVCVFVFVLFARFFLQNFLYLIFLILPVAIVSSTSGLVIGGLYGFREFKKFKVLQTLISFLKLLFIPLFFILYDLPGALIGLLPTYLFTIIVGFYWLVPKVPKINVRKESTIKVKEILAFTTPLYIEGIFTQFRTPALVFITAYFIGIKSEIGYIFIAITLTEVIVTFLLILCTAVYPNLIIAFSKNNKKEVEELLNHVIRYASIMAFFAIFIIFFLGDQLVALLLGTEYQIVGELWKILSFSLISVSIGAPYRRLALIYKRTEINQVYSMFFFFLIIFLAVYLLPISGIVGLSYGYVISWSLPLVFTTIVLFRISRIKINFLDIFKISISAIISFGVPYFLFTEMKLIAAGIFTVIYLLLLYLTGTLRKRDFSLIRSLLLKK